LAQYAVAIAPDALLWIVEELSCNALRKPQARDRHPAITKHPEGTMVRLAAVLVAALAVLALHAPLRAAEDYPSKPVTIVVSLAAGTGMDALTRLYAEKLSQALGKPVIVENKPGAATTLAANQVANAPADGHTVVVLTSIALAINPTLYSSSGSRVRNRGPSPPARR
jgi:hypothetical protein